jgi:arylsulfatase A-like enzyme
VNTAKAGHCSRGQPFFLNVWFHEPRAPIAAPDEVVSRYGNLNDPAAIYSGTIDNTDRAISRLLEKLKQGHSLENTLIIYSSDNGSYRADRVGYLRGIKGSNYDGGIRVPGIFSWPGNIAGGRVEHEPAGLVDLLPTVCGLLGIDRPTDVHLDGSDLAFSSTSATIHKLKSNASCVDIFPSFACILRPLRLSRFLCEGRRSRRIVWARADHLGGLAA